MTNAVNLASAAGTGFAFRNRIINGDMRVDQRNGGAAVTVATSAWTYVLDRWRCYTQSGAGSASISQVIATDTGGSFAYLRFNQTVATTISSPYISQPIEDIRNFNGTTVTLSFRARVASGTAGIATGFTKNYGSGGSAAEYPTTVSHTLTTSWQTFTYTVALSSNAGKTIGASSFLDVYFALPAQATFDIHITDVQLEIGSVATPFERRPYGLELALCERYYQRLYVVTYQYVPGAATVYAPLAYTTMRTTPTASVITANLYSGTTSVSVSGTGPSGGYVAPVGSGAGYIGAYPLVALGAEL